MTQAMFWVNALLAIATGAITILGAINTHETPTRQGVENTILCLFLTALLTLNAVALG